MDFLKKSVKFTAKFLLFAMCCCVMVLLTNGNVRADEDVPAPFDNLRNCKIIHKAPPISNKVDTNQPFPRIWINIPSNGTINIEPKMIAFGDNFTVELLPDIGFKLSELTVNGLDKIKEVKNNKLTVYDIRENIVIMAYFEDKNITCEEPEVVVFEYVNPLLEHMRQVNSSPKITIVPTVNGKIEDIDGNKLGYASQNSIGHTNFESGVRDIIVRYNETKTFKISPDEGYKLEKVTVNGQDKTKEVNKGRLVISNICKNQNIELKFKKHPFDANMGKIPFSAKINVDSINVRRGPGKNYATTGKYKSRNDKVNITKVSRGEGATVGWGLLKDERGWISLDYVTKLDIPFTVKVDTDNVGVYTGPGSNYNHVFNLERGIFTVIEIRTGEGSDKGFGRLKSGVGWIYLDDISIIPFKVAANVDNDNFYKRNGAGIDYNKIEEIKKDTMFNIIDVRAGEGSSAGWGLLEDKSGWIPLDCVIKK